MSDNDLKSEESPFAGFQSEAYDAGKPIETEPDAAPEPEPKEEVEEAPAKDDTPQPPAEEGEQPAPADKEGDLQPKKTAQERINEITRARREAERRAEAAEARTRELEARLSAPPKEAAPPKVESAKEVAAEGDPKPDDYEYGELDSGYIRALASHEADKRFAELRQQDEQVRTDRALQEKQSAAREQFEVMISSGSKKHEDFYEKVVVGSEKGAWPLSEVLGELILESDVGNDVAYHLATHPEEADRVHRSSPVEQARYFGRMETQFSAGQTAASGTAGKPAPRTPKAPQPVETARGAGGQFHATADTDDFSAFEARATKGS